MKTKRIRQHTAERRPSPAVDAAPAPDIDQAAERLAIAINNLIDQRGGPRIPILVLEPLIRQTLQKK